jgi:hypothetical protein
MRPDPSCSPESRDEQGYSGFDAARDDDRGISDPRAILGRGLIVFKRLQPGFCPGLGSVSCTKAELTICFLSRVGGDEKLGQAPVTNMTFVAVPNRATTIQMVRVNMNSDY